MPQIELPKFYIVWFSFVKVKEKVHEPIQL